MSVGPRSSHSSWDENGSVLARAKKKTKPERGYDEVVARIAEVAMEACEKAKRRTWDRHHQASVSACPDPSTRTRARSIVAVNLKWDRKPIAATLAKPASIKVAIGNDVNLGALGEATWGAGRKAKSVFALFVGTGLGGGLVLDGKLINGTNGMGGEIGHVVAPFGNRRRGCGQRGCLETIASKRGIEKLVAEYVLDGEECTLEPRTQDSGSGDLADAWRKKCPATRLALDETCEGLAWAIASLSIIDPEVIVFGGGVMEELGQGPAGRHPQGPQGSLHLRRHGGKPKLVIGQLDEHAVGLGAAVLLVDK